MTHKTNRNERHVSMYMLTSSRFVFDRALILTVSFPGNRTPDLPHVFHDDEDNSSSKPASSINPPTIRSFVSESVTR